LALLNFGNRGIQTTNTNQPKPPKKTEQLAFGYKD